MYILLNSCARFWLKIEQNRHFGIRPFGFYLEYVIKMRYLRPIINYSTIMMYN
jgi:hypothetical protein